MPSPLPKPMYANSASRSEALPVVRPGRRRPVRCAAGARLLRLGPGATRCAADGDLTEPAPQPMPQRETVAPRPIRVAMVQRQLARRGGGAWRSDAHGDAWDWWGSGPDAVRRTEHAQPCLAELRILPKLRRRDVPQAVFRDRLALHRPILSLSAGPLGMAESYLAMGRWLVDAGLQG